MLEELNLPTLDDWPEELAQCAQDLIQEYHDIFSLDKNELGCANSVKHKIEVDNSEPVKECF